MLWANPVTSIQLIGPVRYSIVYDVPIFVAYLSVVPGMAVFFVRIEADFAQAYLEYFGAVREGETLQNCAVFAMPLSCLPGRVCTTFCEFKGSPSRCFW